MRLTPPTSHVAGVTPATFITLCEKFAREVRGAFGFYFTKRVFLIDTHVFSERPPSSLFERGLTAPLKELPKDRSP